MSTRVTSLRPRLQDVHHGFVGFCFEASESYILFSLSLLKASATLTFLAFIRLVSKHYKIAILF